MSALVSPLHPDGRMSVSAFRRFQASHPGEKWELVAGELFMMTGGTMRHARLIRNLGFALHSRLKGGRCEVFMSDVNVINETIDFSALPDVVVRCADRPLDLEREMTDPTACFEVLSPSTRHIDQGGKLSAHFRTDSIRAIAMIHADEVRVEARLREGEAFRELTLKALNDVLPLPVLGIEASLAEIYEGVDV